jgi:hypothetical protein
MNFATDCLEKPNRGGVADAEVPCRHDGDGWIILDVRYPAVAAPSAH